MLVVLLVLSSVSRPVESITNQKVNTLQQILASQTDHQTLRRVLQSPLPRSPGDEPPGIETLQMMMSNLPPTNRELQMIIGDNKDNLTMVSDEILDRIDSPRIDIPADAPLTFDVNKFIAETGSEDYEDVIDLDEEFLYEDVDNVRQSLTSAFLSSRDPFSVSLSPGSSLMAKAGDLVFIKFVLTNRGPVTKFFLDSGVGGVVGEGLGRERMVFPGEVSIIQTLDPKLVLLGTNQSEEIKVGVTVSSSSPVQSRHLVHLTVSPAVTTDQLQPLTIQSYLTVTQEKEEEAVGVPRCGLETETYLQSCQHHLLSPLSCQLSTWTAALSFSDPTWGLQEVVVSPESGTWVRENFVLGTRLEHRLDWSGDCCTHAISFQVRNTRGNTVVCRAGIQEIGPVEETSRSLMISVIIVITITLLGVIISAMVIIFIIRNVWILMLIFCY